MQMESNPPITQSLQHFAPEPPAWAKSVVNMILKEASMSRYPGWQQYKKRSWWLLPPVI